MQQHHTEILKEAFIALGIEAGDSLLVHGNLELFARQQISPFSIIQGLRAVLGTDGTLLFPTFSDAYVLPVNPVFDAQLTQSNVGALSEYFRIHYATGRSLHPTHSIAGCGKSVYELLSRHIKDYTPQGANSPMRKLAQVKGKVLLLGTDFRTSPLFHGIEEEVNPPYLFQKQRITMKVFDEGQYYLNDYKQYDGKGYQYRWDRLLEELDEGVVTIGAVTGVVSHLVQLDRFWEITKEKLEGDPYFLVERK